MNSQREKILIVDDDPDFVASTGIVLKSAGYEVVEAYSGKEGLEKAKSECPDLFIIDLMMETYSEGANLVEALSKDEQSKDKPRIMITSVDLKGPWDSYPSDNWLPCDYLLQKPVPPEELLRKVRQLLSRK
ncbi:MAG: response regulator [Deltaproteobacteria bacterium]|nr:response regulator [Deltaproteobacteria bacterium]MBW2081949.1 response regulator [Deltaproteobacteria bacterium]